MKRKRAWKSTYFGMEDPFQPVILPTKQKLYFQQLGWGEQACFHKPKTTEIEHLVEGRVRKKGRGNLRFWAGNEERRYALSKKFPHMSKYTDELGVLMDKALEDTQRGLCQEMYKLIKKFKSPNILIFIRSNHWFFDKEKRLYNELKFIIVGGPKWLRALPNGHWEPLMREYLNSL